MRQGQRRCKKVPTRFFGINSSCCSGNAAVASGLRMVILIRRMSWMNPLWRAPRIHGEPLKLGFEVAEPSVAKYMGKRRGRAPFCAITPRTTRPWICSWFPPSASNCCAALSSFVCRAATWSGST